MSKRTRTRIGHNPTNEKRRRQVYNKCWGLNLTYTLADDAAWADFFKSSEVFCDNSTIDNLQNLTKTIPGVTKVAVMILESEKTKESLNISNIPISESQPEEIVLAVSGIRGTRGSYNLTRLVDIYIGGLVRTITPNTKLRVKGRVWLVKI
jgi:hypothetical protein